MSKTQTPCYVVTGGNGYIGSHMCKYLHGLRARVVIIDNHSTSPAHPVHDFGECHRLDIADHETVTALLRETKPDAVFHFAAKTLVGESEARPFYYYAENFQKTLALLESCVRADARRLVFSSTCAIFGAPHMPTLDEAHPQHPMSTYGRTKQLMELAMRDLAGKGLLDVAVFRYFNAAGCTPDGTLGENHDPETHLIPNLCRAHVPGSAAPFVLHGDDYDTPDGTCIRDYIHVDDLVRVHARALPLLAQGGFHDFNLGSETGHSVREVIAAFETVTGAPLPVTTAPRRPGDVPRLVANAAKAKTQLDFAPRHTLHDCIAHTLQWFAGSRRRTLCNR